MVAALCLIKPIKNYIFGREEFQKSGTEKLQPQLNNTK